MSEFIKAGNRIIVKPEGIDYDLIPGKVYNLKYDDYQCLSYFEEDGLLNMPKRMYKLDDDDKWANRILTYFNSDKASLTTGVLLSGNKGTGKTVFAKRIAQESKLPVAVVDNEFPAWRLNDMFKQFDTPLVLIFDEIEKNERYWRTDKLLEFLDGVQANTKKLVIMTCNRTNSLDDNLFDRCSRIRYHRKYKDNSNIVFIKEMAIDKGIENVEEVVEFIKENMSVLSVDNISCFLDEVLLFGKECSLTEVASFMNLTLEGGEASLEDDPFCDGDDEDYDE